MPRPKRPARMDQTVKVVKYEDKEESSNSESDFDEDEDPDKISIPGGGKDLASSVQQNTTKTEAGTSSVSSSVPSVPAASIGGGNAGTKAVAASDPIMSAGSTILEQLMSKPTLPSNSKMAKNPLFQGVAPSTPYINMGGGFAPANAPYPRMNIYPTMQTPNPSQFFPSGMDMASFSNAMNAAMMMNPSIQAALNPYMMAAAGNSALLSQLLAGMSASGGGGQMFQNWGGMMPQMQNKAFNQLWMMNNLRANAARQDQEDEENDDEDMGVAETYADYMPAKLKIGKKHPDPVVETASLSSVEPLDVYYKLSLPNKIYETGALSALQLEAITYTAQQHDHLLPDGSRAGFLIGDGAGVGKGRTIAGIIYENYLKGRKKALWISVSNDLKYDSERDLSDIGATKVKVYALNKMKYAKITSAANAYVKEGVIFSTYSALIGESNQTNGKFKTRLKQILEWCGKDFEGPIIFDECHRAKNLCPVGSTKPTKTGLTVLELQKQLPKGRVVYASATGASEPRNMAYMVRLGMWGAGTPFRDFNEFIGAVEKRGVGAMEIVAMDMKLRGMYIARQLSFHGVTFKIEEVPIGKEFQKMYDDSVQLWVDAMQKFQEAAELVDAENRMRKTMWGQFWSAHQRFFKYLCIAAKVKHAVDVAREAIKCGKCVVIGLQSTGEARTLEQLERDEGELTDFVSTAKGVMQSLVDKHFPAPDRNRILKLLGIDTRKQQKEEAQNQNGESSRASAKAGGSGGNSVLGKRSSVRQAILKSSKKSKNSSDSGSETNGSEFDSDFKMSDEDGSVSEEQSEGVTSDSMTSVSGFTDDEATYGAQKATTKKKKQAVQKKQTGRERMDMLLLKGEGARGGPPKDAVDRACAMKEELLQRIEAIGDLLPPNTLDQLIDELGGPENVAEMTGRKGRVVQTDAGIQYESRSEVDIPLETLNLTEKQRFMDGEKCVAIISEAASSGISLQSDRRVLNQKRRVHITLELPWSADRAIQQFGRTHRSNQVNAPEYIFLISDLAGERRFASIVAKRLESLGALTHGDRRATETRDLSRFNIDNKYGRSALEATMRAIMGYESPMVPPPKDYKGEFFKDVAGALVGVGIIVNSESSPGVLTLDKDYNNMSKFLNRILGMPVELQNRLFKYFTDTLQAIITQAKKSGRFDLGILDLGTGGENVKCVKKYKFLRKHATGVANTELHVIQVERGMSWELALNKSLELTGPKEGFYISHQVRNGKQTAILAVSTESDIRKGDSTKKDSFYTLYRPNTGLQIRQETLAELEKKYKKIDSKDGEKHWTNQYNASEKTCSHAYWNGNCKNVTLGLDCEVGLRKRTYNVLAGSVLSVWARVENVLAARTGHNMKMQVVRLRTTDGRKLVGTIIPNSCVETLRQVLASDAEKTTEESFGEESAPAATTAASSGQAKKEDNNDKNDRKQQQQQSSDEGVKMEMKIKEESGKTEGKDVANVKEEEDNKIIKKMTTTTSMSMTTTTSTSMSTTTTTMKEKRKQPKRRSNRGRKNGKDKGNNNNNKKSGSSGEDDDGKDADDVDVDADDGDEAEGRSDD